MWVNALGVVTGNNRVWFRRSLTTLMVGYALWNAVLAGLYFVLPDHTILVASCAVSVAVRGVVSIVYLYMWRSIRNALHIAAHSPSLCSLLITPVGDLPAATDDVSMHNAARARDMLARISRVSAGFTFTAFLKLAILLYTITTVINDGMSMNANDWWALIFVDYLFTDLLCSSLVLVLLRKRGNSSSNSGKAPAATNGYARLPAGGAEA